MRRWSTTIYTVTAHAGGKRSGTSRFNSKIEGSKKAMKRPLAYITALWGNNEIENTENAALYCRKANNGCQGGNDFRAKK